MNDSLRIENMFSVKDKVILITGAGGTGPVNARCCAGNGSKVIVASRNMDKVDRLKKTLKEEGLTIEGIQMDIADHKDIIEKVAWIAEEYGRIDGCIHTAAGCHVEDTMTFAEEELRKILNDDLLGTIFLNQEVGKVMEKQGSGSILNYNSIDCLSVNAIDAMGYGVGKSGVAQATKFFAVRLAPSGVTVNGVAPIWINTPMMAQRPQSYLDAAIGQVPMGRMSEAEDYLGLAIYLMSEAGKFTTGQTFLVDGGWSITRCFTYSEDK